MMEGSLSESSCGTTTTQFVDSSEDGMAHIFSFLSMEELSVCRLVSKFWYDVSFPIWIHKAPCTTLHEIKGPRKPSIAEFLARFHGDESRQYSEYEYAAVRQFKRFSLQFHQHASKDDDDDEVKVKNQVDLLKRFLASCGSWITELELEDFTFPDMETFEDVLYAKLTPQLQELTVWYFTYNFEEGTPTPSLEKKLEDLQLTNACGNQASTSQKKNKGKSTEIRSLIIRLAYSKVRLPVGWTDFLEHYPKLKVLQITCNCWDTDKIKAEQWNILNAVSLIRKTSNNKLPLSNLVVDSMWVLYEDPERLRAFYRDAQLPLENLEMHAFESTTLNFVVDMIKLHSSSLKYLRIRNRGALWSRGLDPPLVTSLQELDIEGLPVFSNLNFLKMFPHLKSLRLVPEEPEQKGGCKLISSTVEDGMVGVAVSLAKFHYCYEEEACGPEEVRKIKSWMPNLRSIDIAVTKEGQSAVNESWPQLVESTVRIHE